MTNKSETLPPDAAIYNSRIVVSYIRYIKKHYFHINIDDLLAGAKMESYQVEDEDHWFTQEQINLFHEKLVESTQHRDIAREAGRFAGSSDSLGILKSYVLSFVNPAGFIRVMGRAIPNMVKSCVWEISSTNQHRIRVTVIPQPGAQERPFQCENRIGYLESIFALFKHEPPVIEHAKCMFKGSDVCQYDIAWRRFPSDIWKKIRYYAALSLLAVSAFLFIEAGPQGWVIPTLVFLVCLFVLSILVWKVEKKELTTVISNTRNSTDTLLDKINEHHANAQLVHDVGAILTRQRNIEGILKDITQVLEEKLDYDRGIIFLADKNKKFLYFRAGFGYTGEQLSVMRSIRFRVRPESRGVFVVCFREKEPFLVNDLDDIKKDISVQSLTFAWKMAVKSFICCPITCGDEAVGVLAVDNVNAKRLLLQRDIDLLMSLTPQIGVAVKNAIVTDMKDRQFNSILRALASSIDARDPLTAGHSERVTRFAVGICKTLRMPDEYCEMIRVAALLHDYGKIGIQDSILKKPGILTPDEFEEIKKHATKTGDILEKIEFDGIYKEVPRIASCHHEKWDGSGYPQGLKFDEIPLGARILAVADVFEAITSMRLYRAPMPLEEAFRVLESGKNMHFDPAIVDAFMQYYTEEEQSLDFATREQKETGRPPTVMPLQADGAKRARPPFPVAQRSNMSLNSPGLLAAEES